MLSTINLIILTLPSFKQAKEMNINTYYKIFINIEITCMVIFTLQFILNFIICPVKKKFFLNIFNVIDILTLIPFYINIIISIVKNTNSVENYLFQIIRTVLLFKITTLSSSLMSIGITIRNSCKELLLLLMYLLLAILIFSSLVYYAELKYSELNTEFESIPYTFWWAIITMTTVGYGDLVPKSPLGKFFAGTAALTGILIGKK